MSDVSDIIIIGGGPVGMYGAFYSGMRGMSCKIIDSLPQLGGQLAALYPKKYIYDVPGYTKVLAEDLVSELEKQATQFDPEVCLNEKAVSLAYDNEEQTVIKLVTEGGRIHYAKTVVIAAGNGAFMPRKLDVQRVDELEGCGLHYFVKDPNIFKDKEILIIGGGDSAIDWALNLESVTKKATLIHRTDKFRAHEDSVEKLMNSSIDVKTPFEVKTFHGEDHVEGVTLYNTETAEEIELTLDAVICNIGFITNLGPIENWGVVLEGNNIKVNETLSTNLTGVWGAGDIVTYPGKLKLISTGFADAAVAVNMAKHFVDPKSKVYPGKSSAKPKQFKVD